jgi:hypothetical protein
MTTLSIAERDQLREAVLLLRRHGYHYAADEVQVIVMDDNLAKEDK